MSGWYGLKSGWAENATEAGDRRIEAYKDLLGKNRDKVIAELIDRSGHYWKNRGWSEEQINEYLKGEEGKNHAINDYLTGLTKSLVDENGKPYVFKGDRLEYDKDGNTINDLYTKPITDPTATNAELYSTQGLQALYDADNARTVMGNLFQTIVSITPTGSMRRAASLCLDKFGSRMFSREVAPTIVKSEMGRVTAQSAAHEAAEETIKRATASTYSNGFAKKSFS